MDNYGMYLFNKKGIEISSNIRSTPKLLGKISFGNKREWAVNNSNSLHKVIGGFRILDENDNPLDIANPAKGTPLDKICIPLSSELNPSQFRIPNIFYKYGYRINYLSYMYKRMWDIYSRYSQQYGAGDIHNCISLALGFKHIERQVGIFPQAEYINVLQAAINGFDAPFNEEKAIFAYTLLNGFVSGDKIRACMAQFKRERRPIIDGNDDTYYPVEIEPEQLNNATWFPNVVITYKCHAMSANKYAGFGRVSFTTNVLHLDATDDTKIDVYFWDIGGIPHEYIDKLRFHEVKRREWGFYQLSKEPQILKYTHVHGGYGGSHENYGPQTKGPGAENIYKNIFVENGAMPNHLWIPPTYHREEGFPFPHTWKNIEIEQIRNPNFTFWDYKQLCETNLSKNPNHTWNKLVEFLEPEDKVLKYETIAIGLPTLKFKKIDLSKGSGWVISADDGQAQFNYIFKLNVQTDSRNLGFFAMPVRAFNFGLFNIYANYSIWGIENPGSSLEWVENKTRTIKPEYTAQDRYSVTSFWGEIPKKGFGDNYLFNAQYDERVFKTSYLGLKAFALPQGDRTPKNAFFPPNFMTSKLKDVLQFCNTQPLSAFTKVDLEQELPYDQYNNFDKARFKRGQDESNAKGGWHEFYNRVSAAHFDTEIETGAFNEGHMSMIMPMKSEFGFRMENANISLLMPFMNSIFNGREQDGEKKISEIFPRYVTMIDHTGI
jgi:hypothetical protein